MQQSGIPHAKLLQGKELSYNNINDADAALQLIKEFEEDNSKCCYYQTCKSLWCC